MSTLALKEVAGRFKGLWPGPWEVAELGRIGCCICKRAFLLPMSQGKGAVVLVVAAGDGKGDNDELVCSFSGHTSALSFQRILCVNHFSLCDSTILSVKWGGPIPGGV